MKRLFTALFAIIAITTLSSETIAKPSNIKGYNDPYTDGSIVAQLGVGYGTAGTYGDMVVPPISLAVDYNTNSSLPLSFGGIFAYASSRQKYQLTSTSEFKFEYSYYMFGLRAAYHFSPLMKVSSLDLYAGGLLGYSYVRAKAKVPSGFSSGLYTAKGSYMLIGVYAGAKYYIFQNVAAFAEFGYGIGYVTAGLAMRF